MHTEPRPVKGLRPEIVVTRVAPRLLRLIPPYMMMMWMTMIYIMVIWMMMMSLVTTRYPGGPSSPYSFLFHGEESSLRMLMTMAVVLLSVALRGPTHSPQCTSLISDQ